MSQLSYIIEMEIGNRGLLCSRNERFVVPGGYPFWAWFDSLFDALRYLLNYHLFQFNFKRCLDSQEQWRLVPHALSETKIRSLYPSPRLYTPS